MGMTVTNNDNRGVWIRDAVFDDDTFLATGAITLTKGTILARETASGKLKAFVKGGAGGLEIPTAVLDEDLVATGAGDVPCRPLIKAFLRFEKLIIVADGDNSNIDATVRDQLRDYGLIVQDVTEMTSYDNQ